MCYVPNVAKISTGIRDQCKKYILRTDRPLKALIWENFKWPYLREGRPIHFMFGSTYGGVFGVSGSNGAISSWTTFNKYVGLWEKTMREE